VWTAVWRYGRLLISRSCYAAQKDKSIEVKADIPGVDKNDIKRAIQPSAPSV